MYFTCEISCHGDGVEILVLRFATGCNNSSEGLERQLFISLVTACGYMIGGQQHAGEFKVGSIIACPPNRILKAEVGV